jgi:hypothetical protein
MSSDELDRHFNEVGRGLCRVHYSPRKPSSRLEPALWVLAIAGLILWAVLS